MTSGTASGNSIATFGFPDFKGPEANERANSLLGELLEDDRLNPHLDKAHTGVRRTDRTSQDFGATLVAVLGTPALIILARTVKSWAERTGTSTIEMNGVRIENVQSRDIADIVKALQPKPQP